MTNFVINNWLIGVPQKKKKIEKLRVNIPFTILIDPTSACNLRCEGCWAGAQVKHDTLSYELLDRILTEAKEVGIYWMVLSGGEPFIYPDLFEIAEKHNDMAFMIYTSGTLINDKVADKIVELGNITPAISLEGWKERTDTRRGDGVFDKDAIISEDIDVFLNKKATQWAEISDPIWDRKVKNQK